MNQLTDISQWLGSGHTRWKSEASRIRFTNRARRQGSSVGVTEISGLGSLLCDGAADVDGKLVRGATITMRGLAWAEQHQYVMNYIASN